MEIWFKGPAPRGNMLEFLVNILTRLKIHHKISIIRNPISDGLLFLTSPCLINN